MVRRIAVGLLLLLSVALFATAYGCGSGLPDGAVAQVGNGVVTQEEYDAFVAAYEAAGKAPDKGKQPEDYELFKQKCAEYLVILEVLYQQGPDFDVSVTPADIDAGVAQISGMFLGDDAKFQEAVAQQGMTLDQLRMGIEQNLWLERMREAVTSRVTIKESEVQAYYDQHESEYILAESRQVRHILISPFLDASGNMLTDTPSQSDWDAAETEAAKVRSEIMNGANFVTMVEEYSDDVSSKSNEGELGDVVRGQTDPAFEQAVFNLKKDELSQPVRTQPGYSVIQVTDITPAQQLAYDSVKEQIRSKLLAEEEAKAWDDWLTETIQKLGVIYKSGYAPPDAVIAAPPSSTTLAGQEDTAATEGATEESPTSTTSE